jgi:MFS family permease
VAVGEIAQRPFDAQVVLMPIATQFCGAIAMRIHGGESAATIRCDIGRSGSEPGSRWLYEVGMSAPVHVPERLVTKPFMLVTSAAAAFFIYVGVLVPLIPRLIEDELGGGEFGIGMSVAVFALSAISVRPLITRGIDRFGRRAVMMAGGTVAAAASAFVGFADSLPEFLALRAVMGVGEAALFVAAATLVADLAPSDRRAEASSYFSVAVFSGIGIGPIIGEWLLDRGTFAMAFAVAGAFSALAALLSINVPSRVTPPDAAHDPADPTTRATATTAPVAARSRSSFIHPAAVGPGLVLASGIGAFAVFPAFVPDHAREVGMSGSGPLFAVYSGICLVVRITGARLPERLGARRSVTIALVMSSLAMGLLAAIAEPWALWSAAAIVGFGMAFLYPSLMALTVNKVTPQERPAAVSSFTMFFEMGSVAGGLVLGLIAELTDKRFAFAGAVGLCLFGLYVMRTHVTPPRARIAPATGAEALFVPVAGD